MNPNIFSKYNVLIVDEDKYLAKLMGSVLSSMDLGRVSVVHSQKEGMNYLTANTDVDVLITDWLKISGNGLEMIKTLRADETYGFQTLPIILCTAMTSLNNIYLARDSGVNEIIIKPVAAKEVVKKMASALFKNRNFVKTDAGFIGPDRRRVSRGFKGEDRRTPRTNGVH